MVVFQNRLGQVAVSMLRIPNMFRFRGIGCHLLEYTRCLQIVYLSSLCLNESYESRTPAVRKASVSSMPMRHSDFLSSLRLPTVYGQGA